MRPNALFAIFRRIGARFQNADVALKAGEATRAAANIGVGVVLSQWLGDSPAHTALRTLWVYQALFTFAIAWGMARQYLIGYRNDAGDAATRPLVLLSAIWGAMAGLGSAALASAEFPQYAAAASLFGLFVCFGSTSMLAEYRAFAQRHAGRTFAYGGGFALIQLWIILVCAVFDLTPVVLCAGLAASTVLKAVFFFLELHKAGALQAGSESRASCRPWLTATFTYAGLYFVSGAGRYADELWIKYYCDARTFIMYGYGAREFPLLLALVNAFGAISLRRIASARQTDDWSQALTLRRSHTRLCLEVGLSACALMAAAPALFAWAYTAAFAEAGLVFSYFLLLTPTRLLFPQSVLAAYDERMTLVYIALGELALRLTAGGVLGALFGWQGVWAGALAANVFEKTVSEYYARKTVARSLAGFVNLPAVTAVAVALIVVWALRHYVYGLLS